jgi:hypothetical protein
MTRSIAWDKVTHAGVLRAIQEYDQLGPGAVLLCPWIRSYHDLRSGLGQTPLPAESNLGHGL